MKNIKSLTLLLLFLVIYGASTTSKKFYQIYETSSEQAVLDGKSLRFEDANCQISYNLWAEGGNPGFSFFNKSKEVITIKKDNCFFIMNGIAYDYFLNRIITTTSDFSYSNDTRTSNFAMGRARQSIGRSNSFTEDRNILIPPNAMKFVGEHIINSTPFRDCNLMRFPDKNDKAKIEFNQSNSPFVFKNYITYLINEEEYVIENTFFVNTIYNLPQSQVIEVVTVKNCGIETYQRQEIFRQEKPNSFYIKYQSGPVDQPN